MAKDTVKEETKETVKPLEIDSVKLEAAFVTHRPEIIGLMAGKYKNVSGQLVKDLLAAIELPSEISATLSALQEAESFKKRIYKPREPKEKKPEAIK